MSLLFWMPMTTDDLINQGLSNAIPVNRGTTVSQNGKLGKCRYFDGNVNGIDTGFKESFGTGDFSIAAWFYLVKNTSRSYQPIITNKSTGAASVGCGIYFNKNQMKFLWSTADGSNATEVWMSTALTEDFIYDKWHHIIMVRDSNDSKKGYFYIDSVRYELASIPPIRNVTNTSVNFCIGGMPSDYASYRWSGSMNDIRIYDHALSPREVKEISKGLVLHYTLSGSGMNLLPCTYTKSSPRTTTSKNGDGNAWVPNSAFEAKPSTTYTISVECDGNLSNTHGSSGMPPSEKPWSFWLYICNTNTTKDWVHGAYDTPVNLTSANHNYRKIGNTHVWTYTLSSTQKYISLRTNSYSNGTDNVTINWWNMKVEEGAIFTPWIPNSSDALYTKMGFNNNVEYDVSGYSYNGTKVGTLTYNADTPKYWTSTYIANGATGHLEGISLPLSAQTLSLWVKCDKTKNQCIFCDKNSELEFGFLNGYALIRTVNQSGYTTIYWINNEWNHVAVIKDNNVWNLYINGHLEASTSALTNYYMHSANNLWIGNRSNNNSYPSLNCLVSDVRIYSTALSSDDILELYNTPISLTSSGVLMTSGELTEA